MSRTYTEEEMREQFLGHLRNLAYYWSNVPNNTALERTQGMAHSILCIFDGCCGALPAFDLVVRPHEDDKQYAIDNEDDYYEDGMEIECGSLKYQFFHPPGSEDKS